MRRLLILCASTWGQFGNLNAARRLARWLEPLMPAGTLMVQPAEEWCPVVARAGARMRDIASTSSGAKQRGARYLSLIRELEARFPPDFEKDAHGLAGFDAEAMAAAVDHFDPQLVIGTKGFVTRLADAVLREARCGAPLVNYVTNDGLLTLPLHRTRPEILNLVQTEFGRGLLPGHSKVEVVGPLVGRAEGRAEAPAREDARPVVAILCNRNPEYRSIYDALIERGENVRVKTIIMGCPELLEHVGGIAPAHWEVWDARAVETYLHLLDEIGGERACLLVTKSAPNSVFEAVAAGIPVLALASGLPMESWVAELVSEQGIGWAPGDLSGAISTLCELVDQPDRISAAAMRARAYAAERLNNEGNAAGIHRAVTAEMSSARETEGAQ